MAATTFIAKLTNIKADWLNDVNAATYYNAVPITPYASIAAAVAANPGRDLLIPAGTYNITTNTDLTGVRAIIPQGVFFNISPGVILSFSTEPVIGDYQVFSTTGTVISCGRRNPMWWGAVRSTTSPGAMVAAANTLAFRKAGMSFYSEYVLNAGTLASPGPYQYPFSVDVPEGAFYLSNGFATAVGVPVRGRGVTSLLCRLLANVDGDTAIPLLTIGQSLAAGPGLAYQNDPGTGQSSSTFTGAGFAQTSAMAHDLYFVDQNSVVGAFCPRYPGAQFCNLFFTSCGLALNLNNCADITGTNLIVDQGLTGLSMTVCQNVRLNNLILYKQGSQAVAVGNSVFDSSVEAQIEYPQGIAINVSGSNIQNLKFPNLNITQNASVGTNQIVVADSVSNVEIDFANPEFRNFGNCTAVVIGASTTSTSLRFKGATFDGSRTNPVYNANTNMQAFSVSSGTIILEGCEMRNLAVRSIFANASTLLVRGLRYTNMTTAASCFDLSGMTGGDAEFYNVKGDDVTPLLTNALGLGNVRVKGSSAWLGTAFADGSFLSWNVPVPIAGHLLATVTGSTDGTANLRKSATVMFEISDEISAGPTITQTITSTTLAASPLTNGHPAAAPTLVFSTNATTQVVGALSPTAGKLRVPNTYTNVTANLEYMA